MVLCATLVRELGARCVPHLPVLVPQLIEALEASTGTRQVAGPAPSKEDMLFEYPAWAEDGMTRLAQYYGVPAVSLRDALFHELKAADPRFPVKQVFHDRHHPGAWGHSLMAQMVVGLLSAATTEVAADLGPPQTAWGQPRAASAQASAAATRDRLCGQAQSEARRRDRGGGRVRFAVRSLDNVKTTTRARRD